VVEHLPSKSKAMSSIFRTANYKTKEKKKKMQITSLEIVDQNNVPSYYWPFEISSAVRNIFIHKALLSFLITLV
jgi:hypothetical protein